MCFTFFIRPAFFAKQGQDHFLRQHLTGWCTVSSYKFNEVAKKICGPSIAKLLDSPQKKLHDNFSCKPDLQLVKRAKFQGDCLNFSHAE